MNSIRRKIRLTAKRLKLSRLTSEEHEAVLQSDIDFLVKNEGHGSAKSLSIEIGVSEAYLSDIRHRNRGIGDDMVNKLTKITL